MHADGTVVFSDVGTDLINNRLKLVWTHCLVWLDKGWFEATWPRVTRSKDYRHKKQVIIEPQVGLRYHEMLRVANENLGRRYSAQGYFHPELYGKTKGIYCSQYVAMILVAGGARLTIESGRDPDKLFKALTGKNP
jgi:hypothetical protein